jgi:hypothetical protein
MKISVSTLALIVAITIVVSLLQHLRFSGAYIRSTPIDEYTYFIGPVSTTIPFVIWALVTVSVALIRRGRPNHIAAMICGYLAGWIGMSAFTFWIISWPQTFGHSSTMAIADVLTAFMYAAIFPVLFPPGYLFATVLLHLKSETWKPLLLMFIASVLVGLVPAAEPWATTMFMAQFPPT